MAKEKHFLVLRFSAMGDVAMTIPVLRALFSRYPKLRITLVSRPQFKPLFDEFPQLHFFPLDLDQEHKGIKGMWRLFLALRPLSITGVADLHGVLRTHLLRTFFLLTGHRCRSIDKGRNEKRALTRPKDKRFKPLTHTVYRYAAVFQTLGFAIDPSPNLDLDKPLLPTQLPEVLRNNTMKWIGIAPFASFEGKIYPLDLMQQVVAYLQKEHQILLFGGGDKELNQLAIWEKAYPHVTAAVSRLPFSEQLAVIGNLDVMVSMDSGNGHLAANAGVPVITLWGVTHPYAGFAPFGQAPKNALTADREQFHQIPTSVYGNRLPKGYEKAFRSINPKTVIEKVLDVINT